MSIEKAEVLHSLFLNEIGVSKLIKQGVYKELGNSLSLTDLECLRSQNIYINPIFSPASTNRIKKKLDDNCILISIDINALSLFTRKESTAIILHEIGHALNIDIKGDEGEFIADEYASERGYSEYIKSLLERGISSNPELYDTELTIDRIAKIDGF